MSTSVDHERDDTDAQDLEELLDQLEEAASQRDEVHIGDVVDAIGRRSFGPLLLVSGLIVFSPLSGIPGVPSIVGILVALITVQMLIGRNYFWLPGWIERRGIKRERFCKAVKFLRRPARFVDRFLRPRLQGLTNRLGAYTVALTCTVIAVAMPPLELIPFSTTVAGAAIAAFGLALIARDGLLGLIALGLTGGVAGLVGVSLL